MKQNTLVAMLTIIIAGAIGFGTYFWLNQNNVPTEPLEDNSETFNEETSNIEETASGKDAPFFLTTMTHMEGNHNDDEIEGIFWTHVEQLKYGMDLADEYDAILTIESEKPFARANTIWDYNMMQEIMDRGHGVGTHCDIAANDQYSLEELTALFKENKTLVDELIGEENNHGCSGGGSANDWVNAAVDAGFEYINGIVGFHLLAVDQSNRPDPTWTTGYIKQEAYHYHVPAELSERIYLMQLKDLEDFEHDEDGTLVISNGEMGKLEQIHESWVNGEDSYGIDSELNEDDVDTLVEIIREVDGYRDRDRVAKLTLYFPVNIFTETNEEILRYFFSEMQKLQDEGIIQWSTQWNVVQTYLEMDETDEPEDLTEATPEIEDGTYTVFSMNTHDWVFLDQSIETINRVIDIHEEYDVPVGIYLTDPIVQGYMEEAPELMERLKTSPVVDVSYHFRPSTPLYSGFDILGMADMDDDELYEAILRYEEYKLDLETGLTTDEPGGYQYLKDILGYAPLAVGHTDGKVYGEILSQIYKEKGALFAVVHGKDSNVGDTVNGLYKRPEHLEIKLYESAGETQDGGEVIEARLGELPGEGAEFIGIKYHENNFYSTNTPFWPVFWEEPDKSTPLKPPYDLNASEGVVVFKPESLREKNWELYESTVAFVAENRDIYHPVGLFDVSEMLGEGGDPR